uniref:peptidoglycan-binding domain-containing protein n=1 Tax=Faecousia sp. TaxID=2952921 RepID=UPI004027F19B
MKHTKRILATLMVMALMIVTLALPASAAGNSWGAEFSAFPTQSQNSYSIGYTKAIQTFLCCCDSSEMLGLIMQGGGIDGIYGGKTAAAVKVLQKYSTNADGICGPVTWRIIGNDLMTTGTMTDGGKAYTTIGTKLDENQLYRIRNSRGGYEYSVNNIYGTGWTVFRTE